MTRLERLEQRLERASHPCKYGHVDCASSDGGACLDELIGQEEDRLHDDANLLTGGK